MTDTPAVDPLRVHRSAEVPALLERLRAVRDLIDGEAARSEELGRLTDATFEAIRDAGTFSATIPTSLGGLEASPVQLVEIVEELSYASASAGWATMTVLMSTGTTAAYQPRSSTEGLFAQGHIALFAGQGNRMGTAVPVEGGYRLTGEWGFASGSPHATHVHTGGMVEGTGEKRIFSFPKDQATFIDNWDVLGLRATGSVDYTCTDVFVPEDHTYPIAAAEPYSGGAFYRLGLGNMAGIFHGGWALGVGRRLLDELARYVRTPQGALKPPFAGGQFLAEFALIEAQVRAARAFQLDTWRQIETALESEQGLTATEETLARLALGTATRAAQDAAAVMYKWASSTALRSGTLQRLFRDANSGSQHISSGPGVLEKCGEMLAVGIDAGTSRWSFGSLVPVAAT